MEDEEEDRSCYWNTLTGYWKFKQEVLDRTLWRIRFGNDYGPAVKKDNGMTAIYITIQSPH